MSKFGRIMHRLTDKRTIRACTSLSVKTDFWGPFHFALPIENGSNSKTNYSIQLIFSDFIDNMLGSMMT